MIENHSTALSETVALGVDIGGTNTKLSLVRANGQIVTSSRFPTHTASGAEGYLDTLLRAIRQLIGQRQESLLGIGVGAPGCDPLSGCISYAVNLPFDSAFPIRDFLAQELCAHTALVKDSTAAALGEKLWGGAQQMDSFILLCLGTGLGSAFFLNGKPVAGAHGLASELGHITLVPGGRQCFCGRQGCLEAYASANGLRRNAQALMAQELMPSSLRELPESALTAQAIAAAAMAGDRLGQLALDQLCQHLGQALAPLVLQLDPQGIFLSGGLLKAGPALAEQVQAYMNKALLPAFQNKVPVQISWLGADEAGALGAAAQLYWQETTIRNL